MYEIAVDLETTVHGPGNSPEAQYDENYVVLYGWKECAYPAQTSRDGTALVAALQAALSAGEPVKLIGHNLKFDLKHLMKAHPEVRWQDIEYHCTMYTEYRQSGHEYRFSSLEASCARHGVPFTKGLDLGALIAAGVEIEDIPLADLTTYLLDDVDATWHLYHKQVTHPDYIEYEQLHIAALAEMELLGLPLDVYKAEETMEDMYIELDVAEHKLWKLTSDLLWWDDGTDLKPKDLKFTSARTVSYLLTGEPAAGLTKRVRKNITFRPNRVPLMTDVEVGMVWGTAKPTHLGYPMSKTEIDELTKISSCHTYMEALLEYRAFNKLIGTYLGPFLEAAKIQPTIHPKLNMCTTATGRLSSSAPNGQNMPEVVRNLFKSEKGEFKEVDYKQLEVMGLAHLSKDPTLLKDILDGEDIHYNTGRHVFKWKTPADMNDKQRKLVKNVNFGLIYGGGAKGLSAQTGQPVKLVKQLIDAFYFRYPGVAAWQKDFYTLVTGNLKSAGFRDGEAYYSSLVADPVSDRKFYFRESASPDWLKARSGRGYSFKPTETKNYPVQGFAGGDIVMTALALLWAWTRERTDTLLRMTVHDSILVDTVMSDNELTDIMEEVNREVEDRYGLPFNLGFDITSGQYWQ